MASRFEGIIREFAGGRFTGADLLRRLAPSAPELKGRGVPADHVYYIDSEKVLTLRTRDPKIGIVWWVKPAQGAEVTELHIKPIPSADMEPFAAFSEACGLGAEVRHFQNGPLSDIQHVFEAESGGSKVEVTVNEIVFAQDQALVGKIGEVTVRKLPSSPCPGPGENDGF